jgi:hypothetical protein
VDYIGIVKALRKALADYTANAGGQGGDDPTVDKEQLIARIVELIAQTDSFLGDLGFSLGALVTAKDFANDIALNTGTGLRYDLEFLVIRLDFGFGLHAPYATKKKGYFNLSPFGDGFAWHFAIGYPF